MIIHKPVLKKEVLEYLAPKPHENFIDATIGEMGHSSEILKRNGPNGRILGIDWDKEQIENCKLFRLCRESSMESGKIENFKSRLILINDSYSNLKKIAGKYNFRPNGILFDLGMSSWHLEKSGRGFSFMRDEQLDMRYNPKFPISNFQFPKLTAEKIVNEYPQDEIERILREYGEERFARSIANRIAEERKIRPIKTTFQLVEIIRKAIPFKYSYGKIHFATRIFQALRIAVNNELDNLKKVLPQAVEILEPGGRIVIISFHSLEDRIIKIFFRENKNQLEILTKKPVTPSQEEIKINPRSRSAKLRAAVKK